MDFDTCIDLMTTNSVGFYYPINAVSSTPESSRVFLSNPISMPTFLLLWLSFAGSKASRDHRMFLHLRIEASCSTRSCDVTALLLTHCSLMLVLFLCRYNLLTPSPLCGHLVCSQVFDYWE